MNRRHKGGGGRVRPRRAARAGWAGLVASAVMAALGVAFGAVGAYMAGRGAIAEAGRWTPPAPFELRDGPARSSGVFDEREKVVAALRAGAEPERFAPPALPPGRPKIIVIFDDMGLDPAAFENVMALPGPLTLSFLPYAQGAQAMVDRARAAEHEILLHLPMEPDGPVDPGPNALRANMTGAELLSALAWNLSRIEGYSGVNNHMGSRMTRHEAAMKTVLSVLDERGLYFIDSVTTAGSVAAEAGRAVGARVFARDVFLDPEAGPETVVRQLALVERIARETGYAVAICHPRPDTLAALGPWLTSAPARGFELATTAALLEVDDAWSQDGRVAAADER
ncbi:divergent polysaccharide deacetylase family protein [Amphiplicatus metriothermophilus]|uniref:Uncharacterized conserved protein YibQ, putative polysaccharide deacetylase 2 family n=1 Tax=Amphiplicatus metriothermophilus TaxID=1519374 RepID=A0A239Q077_9PROT|nr:divergent polysaccharide deacetylase family protein [Amphiplicatus metriothermophilus]MBB5520053.1 polysaccharide deacetylase 2 family uncharacterized protein YibQ [Amphiplicatus metriothermophilus]SNT75830.1 Uncharacterized conserved protein YibQ, putative polysaccharide deacetylase 2 family [Amphiplicatus metriothermophilus]